MLPRGGAGVVTGWGSHGTGVFLGRQLREQCCHGEELVMSQDGVVMGQVKLLICYWAIMNINQPFSLFLHQTFCTVRKFVFRFGNPAF